MQGKLSIAPCCAAEAWEVEKYDFDNDTKLNEIRAAMLEGKKHPACAGCWKQDALGIRSRRQIVNEWATNAGYYNSKVELVKLDYWVGNTCNLACVICSPYASSRWHADVVAMGDNQNMFKITATEYWKDLPDTVIDIHFTGGEPLLSKDHNNFLASVKNKDQVELTYNTNGTVKPSDKLIDLWQQFKNVRLVISMDDIGERFEYQRYPLIWSDFVDNINFLKNLLPNVRLSTFSTIGLLNVFSFPETYKWLTENLTKTTHSHEVLYDAHFAHGLTNCETMPAKFKSTLDELYKNMPERFNFANFIKFEDGDIDPKFYDYLNKLDKIRGLDYKKVFPYLI
jgi:organic radical activating enzyme